MKKISLARSSSKKKNQKMPKKTKKKKKKKKKTQKREERDDSDFDEDEDEIPLITRRLTNNQLADLFTHMINKINKFNDNDDVYYGLLFKFPNLLYRLHKKIRSRTKTRYEDVEKMDLQKMDVIDRQYKKLAGMMRTKDQRLKKLGDMIVDRTKYHGEKIRQMYNEKKALVERKRAAGVNDVYNPTIHILMPFVINLGELKLVLERKKVPKDYVKDHPELNHFAINVLDFDAQICYLWDGSTDIDVKEVWVEILRDWLNCATFIEMFSDYYSSEHSDLEWSIYTFKDGDGPQIEPLCGIYIHWLGMNYCTNTVDPDDVIKHPNLNDNYMKNVHLKFIEEELKKIKK
jgi:hypothetical protein